MAGSTAWHENRIERALLWFYRIVVGGLGVIALLLGETQEAALLGAALTVHALVYLATARLRAPAWWPWVLTLLDVALAGLVFYLTGNVNGPALVLGFVLAGVVAARLGRWPALTTNLLLYITFYLPFYYGWLILDKPFPFLVVGSLLMYVALTLAVSYLVTTEARQLRARRDAAQQLQQLTTVLEVGRTLSSTLKLKTVMDLVASKAAELLAATAGSLLLVEDEAGDASLLVSAVEGPASAELVGRRLEPGAGLAGQVMVSGQGLIVDDPQADPRWSAAPDLPSAFAAHSVICVPLCSRGRTIGVLEVADRQDGKLFGWQDLDVLSTFAAHAAIALENARLYERTDEALARRLDELATIEEIDHELQTRVDEMAALQRITRQLNATLATEYILPVVLDAAVQTAGATHGHVLLRDMTTGQFELGVTRGYTEEEEALIRRRLLEGENPAGQVLQEGQPVIVADAVANATQPCVKAGTRSALSVPIFYEGNIVGVINLRHMQPEAFDEGDVAFVQALAEQAALAIGNALRFQEQLRLNKTLSARNEQMISLLEVSRKLRTDVPLEDTLEEIAYAIQETIGFDLVLISVCEGVPGMMRRVAAAGLPLDQLEEIKQVRQPVARFEALYREEYRVGSCYFFPFQLRAEWAAELHTVESRAETDSWREGEWHPRDMLLVPLRGAGGRLLGQISLDEPRDGQRPSRQTLNALAIFANQAAIAVENASLYADVQRRADSLAQLNQVGRLLTQVLDPAAVLSTLAGAVPELLHCSLSIVYQPGAEDGTFRPVASAGVPLTAVRNLHAAGAERLVQQVAATQRPLLVRDLEKEPQDLALPVPIGSLLLVPLLAGRQCVGVVMAGCTARGALGEADQVLLATLTDQAAVALESARLFAATQQAAVRLSLLNEIGRRAAAQLEFGEMLETTVDSLHQNMGYPRVAVFLLEQRLSRLVVAAANQEFRAVIPAGYSCEPGRGPVGTAAASGGTILVQDTRSDGRYDSVGDWNCLSSLSVPIKLGGAVLGVLHAEAPECWAFQEEDAAALEMAADQLAVAIQNARLFQERERRIRELDALNQMAQAVTATLDLPTLLRTVHEQTGQLMDATNFSIALYDEEKDEISFPYVVDPEGRGNWTTRRTGEDPVGRIVRSGQPLLLPDGAAEAGGGCRSWLGVPMIAGDRVLAVIAVQSYDRENAYDEEQLNFLLTVASQSAMAVRNAQLYQQIVRFSNELEGMV
jgi:GAF domain-containing protein